MVNQNLQQGAVKFLRVGALQLPVPGHKGIIHCRTVYRGFFSFAFPYELMHMFVISDHNDYFKLVLKLLSLQDLVH